MVSAAGYASCDVVVAVAIKIVSAAAYDVVVTFFVVIANDDNRG